MMSGGADAGAQPPVYLVKLEVYRGIHAIAAFLGVHDRTAQRYLRDGKLPAKKDGTGAWVLTNITYLQDLEG